MLTRMVHKNEEKDAARQQQLLKPKSSPGLLRKLTTRLKPSTPQRSANSAIEPPPTSPTQYSTQRSAVPTASPDVAAVKRRRAALQQCGLVPLPRKDLSQLEEELDQRLSHVVILPQDQPEQGGPSTAERIRREWQAKNEIQPQKQGDDLDPKVPNDIASDHLDPEPCGKFDSAEKAEDQKPSDLTTSPPPHTSLALADPVSLHSIPGTSSFPDIPEEDINESDTDKALPPIPSVETVDPLGTRLSDSSSSSSASLTEPPSNSVLRENKRPPPITISITTNDAKEDAEDVARGRSLNRSSAYSLMTKSSLPALSPTMTASSSSSIPTPRDEESIERIGAMITRSSSAKSRTSRFGKVSDTGRNSEDLDVVPESPEHTVTESRTWNPNRESAATIGSAGFEAFVEKREKRMRSIGIFPSSRSSGSISRKSTASELSLRWGSIANDFSLRPFDGARSKSSALLSTPAPADENKEPTPTQSQITIEEPQPKITRSRSIIASLGLKMSRKMAHRPTSPALPSPPPSPVRLPTAKIVENRESLLQEVKGIEDDESRRLTELAFMDF